MTIPQVHFNNATVETDNLVLKSVYKDTVEINFKIKQGDYTYYITAFNDIARAICSTITKGSKLSIVCNLSCWKQGIRIPDTNELLIDKLGNQVLITNYGLHIVEIK